MNITEQAEGANIILSISGRLDSTSSKGLEDVLLRAVQNKAGVVIDFEGLQYVSSAGLRVLLKSAKMAKSSGSKLVLASLAPQVEEVFEVSGFTAIFAIHPDVRSGLASL
ncbi:STAS domain-containing protein [Terrihabitans rhizophilus]|jgi:anti-sigma B factor antagonist|uniref:Anti-sigma factor antagonist n=1 Tax=Terrihabitans rhizophilus TaxID=3092662 RepID=A0ABU4RPW4_9HYPH|nr:STAS domain-containing protein [Terrihabitans sp. PJ23]MDX6806218.1 STAS domain-containing protein [Terrihabitans sp. PJ23]